MPLITVANGTELFYDSFGDPAARPLLLIQGLTAQMIKWREEFCHLLVDAGFYVVRFDNRDVGLSQKFPNANYALSDMAEDTAGLITALKLGPCHVVGQSMGGMIAQILAATHPGLVASLCLLYTTASARWLLPPAADREILADHRDLTREQAIDEFVAGEYACRSDLERIPQDTQWLQQLAEASYDRDPVKSGNVRQAVAALRGEDRLDTVRGIIAPSVVLTGDADRLIDPQASTELHQSIAGSQIHVFPGMGHELPQQLWAEIISAITSNTQRAVMSA